MIVDWSPRSPAGAGVSACIGVTIGVLASVGIFVEPPKQASQSYVSRAPIIGWPVSGAHASQDFTGSFAERIGIRESWTGQGSYATDSVIMLVASLETWSATAVQPFGFGETVGPRDSFSAAPGGQGAFAETIGIRESWVGQDTTAGGGIGDFAERIGILESFAVRPATRSTFSERLGVRESWTGAAGPPSPPESEIIETTRDFIRTSPRRRFGEGSVR